MLCYHRLSMCACATPATAAATHTMACRVVRNSDLHEFLKLEFLREIGFCHVRIGDGVGSRLQLSGLLAKLCKITLQAA